MPVPWPLTDGPEPLWSPWLTWIRQVSVPVSGVVPDRSGSVLCSVNRTGPPDS
jgi:hypothetical protein